jgi:hypothetical protein
VNTATGVTARKAHPCETCSRRDVNGTWTTPIRPGHRYVRHVVFPGDDGFEDITRPQSVRECAGCAIERDSFNATLYGICGSSCCGTTPCALPFEKGAPCHEHHCGECVREAGS